MIAIISDTHGNLEALEAVMDRIGSADAIYCAGDIVGYGPNPNECCQILRERGIKSVMGNHDIVCANLGHLDPDDTTLDERRRELTRVTWGEMNEIAQKAAQWTSEQLTEENRQYLRSLPLELRENGMTIVHGSVGTDYEKLNTYLDEKFEQSSSREGELTLDEFYAEMVEAVQSKILIVGHTHIPTMGYFFVRGGVLRALPFLARERWVINPGSVGQPRKGRDATYAVMRVPLFPYLKVRATFHYLERNVKQFSVAYDRARTIAKIESADGLEEKVRFMLSRWM